MGWQGLRQEARKGKTAQFAPRDSRYAVGRKATRNGIECEKATAETMIATSSPRTGETVDRAER
jgi:hypothetical protein